MVKVIEKPLDRLDPMFSEAPTRYAPGPFASRVLTPEWKTVIQEPKKPKGRDTPAGDDGSKR